MEEIKNIGYGLESLSEDGAGNSAFGYGLLSLHGNGTHNSVFGLENSDLLEVEKKENKNEK